MINLRFIYLVVLVSLLFSCDKRLPEPSQEGANSFACKVNGKSWITDAGDGFKGEKYSLLFSSLFKPAKNFVLIGYRSNEKGSSSIMLALWDVRTACTQYFSYETMPYPSAMRYQNHAGYIQNKPSEADYYTNSRITGSITFTRVDTLARVLAGNFEFTAENTDGSGKKVKVTDGRFDVKYGQ